MIEVVPAIIPEDKEQLNAELSLLRNKIPFVQIDISDGTFAPNTTWPFQNGEDFKKIVSGEEALPFWKDFQFEIDMFTSQPEDHVSDWIKAGASRIIIHLETILDNTDEAKKLEEVALKIKNAGMKLGLSINPSTDDQLLYENLKYADFVQFMGNDKVGFHGVELDEKVLEKIKRLRQRDSGIIIAIDIGVDNETALKLVEAGVNKLVSGSFILNSDNVEETITSLQSLDISH